MKYLSWNGRAGRKEWWLAAFIPAFLAVEVVGWVLLYAMAKGFEMVPLLIFVIPLVWLATVTSIRRYHDRGKSGRWVIMGFIPIIGPVLWLWQIVELGFFRGTEGGNQYGEPRGFSSPSSVTLPTT